MKNEYALLIRFLWLREDCRPRPTCRQAYLSSLISAIIRESLLHAFQRDIGPNTAYTLYMYVSFVILTFKVVQYIPKGCPTFWIDLQLLFICSYYSLFLNLLRLAVVRLCFARAPSDWPSFWITHVIVIVLNCAVHRSKARSLRFIFVILSFWLNFALVRYYVFCLFLSCFRVHCRRFVVNCVPPSCARLHWRYVYLSVTSSSSALLL